MNKKYALWVGLMGLPFWAWGQTHPCLTLLELSAHAGVSAKICSKQINMDALAAVHQQHQCAAFFAQPDIQKTLNPLATQSSLKSAQQAQQMGEQAFCAHNTQQLGNLLQ